MVKITIILDDDLYKELVEEAIKKYGSTRKLSLIINKLSLIINEKLRQAKISSKRKKRMTIKLGRMLKEEELNRILEEIWQEMV
jgi:hypothetical protein